MVNSKKTKIYLFRAFRWRRSISGKYFPKSSTCVIDNGELFFTDFDLDCVTGNIKTEDFT